MRRVAPALVALLALAWAAPARAEWPLAAGSTTIEGSTTGFAEIHVPRALPLAADGRWLPKVRLNGHGRIYGVVLRRDEPASKDPFVLATTSGDGDGDPPEMDLDQYGGFPEGEGDPVMPAGDYRLYLLADGRPVRAEVLLPGLEGTTAVTPQVPVPQHVASLTRLDAGGPAATFAGQATLASAGMALARFHAVGDAEVARRAELCIYSPDHDTLSAVDYGPGCGDPEWLAEQLFYDQPTDPVVPPGHSERGFESYAANASPGTWSVGGNVQDVGAGGTVEMLGAWIGYEPGPGTPLPVRPADASAAQGSSAAEATAPAAPAAPTAKAKAKKAKKHAKKKAKKRKRKKHRRHKHRRKRHR